MAIGTPVQLGSGTSIASGSSFSTIANCPAGNLILVPVWIRSAIAVSSVTDSAGNSYSLAIRNLNGTVAAELWYAANCINLPSAGTITVNGPTYDAAAIGVSGIATASPLDATNSFSGASSTTFSLATGALAQANEIAVGAFALAAGANSGFVEAAGFTSVTIPSSNISKSAYQIVSSAGSVTYAPSWSAARATSAIVATFKAPGASITTAEIACAAQTVAEEPPRAHYLPGVEAY
jgi:hypothetical protein